MRILFPVSLALTLALMACEAKPAAPSPAAIKPSWTNEQADAVLARTQRIHLAPDLSALTPGEKEAVKDLLAAGERIHVLYIAQRHPQGREVAEFITAHPELTHESDLFRM